MSTSRTTSSITCAGLSFEWPDGTPVLSGLDWSAGPGRIGLIGLNGSGKSTLLDLLAGARAPSRGTARISGRMGYLPQQHSSDSAQQVIDILGFRETRAAIRRIEAGEPDENLFAQVGDAWDIEERAATTLGRLGLGHLEPDGPVERLSGGESVLLRLAALLLHEPDVLLLDEPTNNLDRNARHRLYEAVRQFTGTLVAVSHDRELLDLVDRIAELRQGSIRVWTGNLASYEEAVAAEQEAAERTVRDARADVRKQQRELREARDKLATRARMGKKKEANKSEPKIVMGQRKREAQESAGKHRITHERRLDTARQRLTTAADQVRDDEEIRIDLPATSVPSGKWVLAARDLRLRHGGYVGSLDVRGPERIALTGPNGSGKTTLLHTIAGRLSAEDGKMTTHTPLRYLPQNLDVLDPELSSVDNIARLSAKATSNEIRASLARFLLKDGRADQVVATLSGGERFRASLAALLLADPAPRLLLLDEPTNNLDMASVRHLTTALACYSGALIVASHDVPFLRGIRSSRWLRLDGELTATEPDLL